eukprot:c23246_g1_i1 orf=265-1395(-)
MLLQNVPPALLVRFLREHRSEWADYGAAANSTSALQINNFGILDTHGDVCISQVLQQPIHAVEDDEFLELIKLEGREEGSTLPRDIFLLQLCSGLEENTAGASAQMVFAPIDISIPDDVPLLPSGFRAIPLDNCLLDAGSPSRTLDLASTLDVGSTNGKYANNAVFHLRSVLTLAFQFSFHSHMQESATTMSRQYVRNVVSTVQRLAMALAPSRLSPHMGSSRQMPGTPEGVNYARWICRSYKCKLGIDLVSVDGERSDEYLKAVWQCYDAIMCCSCKSMPVFTFANQAGLEMLETSSVTLQELSWEKTLDENAKKSLCSVFSQVMQQGYACLSAGVRLSSMGRVASYERAVAWKVLDDDDNMRGVAFIYVNWSFI